LVKVDVENRRLIVEKAREWWEAEFGLDWSTMGTTFKKLTPELQEKILKDGYWSKGPGNFVEAK
jgi:hypothetical protein